MHRVACQGGSQLFTHPPKSAKWRVTVSKGDLGFQSSLISACQVLRHLPPHHHLPVKQLPTSRQQDRLTRRRQQHKTRQAQQRQQAPDLVCRRRKAHCNCRWSTAIWGHCAAETGRRPCCCWSMSMCRRVPLMKGVESSRKSTSEFSPACCPVLAISSRSGMWSKYPQRSVTT